MQTQTMVPITMMNFRVTQKQRKMLTLAKMHIRERMYVVYIKHLYVRELHKQELKHINLKNNMPGTFV